MKRLTVFLLMLTMLSCSKEADLLKDIEAAIKGKTIEVAQVGSISYQDPSITFDRECMVIDARYFFHAGSIRIFYVEPLTNQTYKLVVFLKE